MSVSDGSRSAASPRSPRPSRSGRVAQATGRSTSRASRDRVGTHVRRTAVHRRGGRSRPRRRFGVVVPMRRRRDGRGRRVGARGRPPVRRDGAARARLVASHAELALHNAERYNRAKERAFIDDVTEVYNARYLLAAMDHEIRRAERYRQRAQRASSSTSTASSRERPPRPSRRLGAPAPALRRSCCSACARWTRSRATAATSSRSCLVDTDHEVAQRIAERIRRTVEETFFDGRPRRLAAAHGEHRRRRPIPTTARPRGPARRRPTRRCTARSRRGGTACVRRRSSSPDSLSFLARTVDSASRITRDDLSALRPRTSRRIGVLQWLRRKLVVVCASRRDPAARIAVLQRLRCDPGRGDPASAPPSPAAGVEERKVISAWPSPT